jgi:hypothetical protein
VALWKKARPPFFRITHIRVHKYSSYVRVHAVLSKDTKLWHDGKSKCLNRPLFFRITHKISLCVRLFICFIKRKTFAFSPPRKPYITQRNEHVCFSAGRSGRRAGGRACRSAAWSRSSLTRRGSAQNILPRTTPLPCPSG